MTLQPFNVLLNYLVDKIYKVMDDVVFAKFCNKVGRILLMPEGLS
jgi:hypothetical protein